MSEWSIGPFDFEYSPGTGRLQMWLSTQHLDTISVPEHNLPAAKVQAANMLLKRLNEWKYRLFEYLKDLDLVSILKD
jgi:hypothetical protein